MSEIPQSEINTMIAAIDAAAEMTREEAITELQKSLDILGMYGSRYGKVLEMAIEALRQPPDDNWETYSSRLWKAAYERGKADATCQDNRQVDGLIAIIKDYLYTNGFGREYQNDIEAIVREYYQR